MAMTAQGLMLSLAGVSVAPMMAFHARSKRADLIRARKVSTRLSAGDPPAHAGALHALGHQGLVGRLDHA